MSPPPVSYDDAYHAARIEESGRSAAVVVPMLLDLFPDVASVVDVGCGPGTWLHQFKLHGTHRVVGLDGSEISPQLLQVPSPAVRKVDVSKPLPPLGRFDLALALDVADCLPDTAANTFIEELVALSDVVVFSAAVPGQSVLAAVNERWPSYWVAQFGAVGFDCFDVLRSKLWYDQRVSWGYSQNILIFISSARDDLALRLAPSVRGGPLDVVHPRAFEALRSEITRGGTADLTLYPFSLAEEGYRGHNILQIDVDKFLALAQSEGAYSAEKLTAGGYAQAYIAPSLDEVKKLIPSVREESGGSSKPKAAQKERRPSKAEERKQRLAREAFPVRLLEEGYRGFNILQISGTEFLALGQSEGRYSPEKLEAGAYKRAYLAASLEDAKRNIKSESKRNASSDS
jgi:SAM-dependent methyltransferase